MNSTDVPIFTLFQAEPAPLNGPLLRFKPDPVPTVNPVPEYLADARMREVYEDTKATMGVPWMGVVMMVLAQYPNFYATLWEGVRDLCRSAEFVAACRELHNHVQAVTVPLEPAPLAGLLSDRGYAQAELHEIRSVIDLFSNGNMPYLMVATVARLLLDGGAVCRQGSLNPISDLGALHTIQRPVLMEAHHADTQVAALFDDIKGRLGLPIVNSDYRALARWPSYFALAWADLRDKVNGPAYTAAVQSVHDQALAACQTLPLPNWLTPEALHAAAERDAPAGEVRDVVRLFQWLLPGLAVNVAYFKAQLHSY